MLRLIACDIDGTLMPNGHTALDPEVFPLIHRLIDSGVEFITCSGRQYANQRRLFAPIADEIGYICENGSLTMWKGKVLACDTLDRSKGEALLRYILEQTEFEVLLSTERCCYVQPKRDGYVQHIRDFVGNDTDVVDDLCAVPEEFIKISMYCPNQDLETIQEQMAKVSAPYLTPVAGGNGWVDFLRENSDKGTALETFCRIRGIDRSECIAIGDNENDLAVLGKAGEMWAMRSGHPELKARADRIIDSVPEELERILAERGATR
ncbi:MAG: HAD-IIB family hydrolase [Butyricicoccus sp.]